MGTVADLVSLFTFVGEDWTSDLMGTATTLFEADVHGLLRVADDVVLAVRNHDVKQLAVRPDVGNTPTEVLMRRSRERGATVDPEGGFMPILLNQFFTYNPPLHTEVRRVLTRHLTPGTVPRFAPLIAELLDQHCTAAWAPDRTSFDVYHDVAKPVAARFWARLIGMTGDEERALIDLLDEITLVFLAVAAPDHADRLDRAVKQYVALVTTAVARSMQHPDTIDPLGRTFLEEMAADLETIDIPGRPATVGLMAAGNLIDGFHTMGVGLANAAALLIGVDDAYAAVRADPQLAAAAYDEGTRLATPLVITYRYALTDLEYDGTVLPAGTLIGMHWSASNRDPEAFDDPSTFRLDRPTRALLTFGNGPHLCPGRNIARLTGTMGLARMTAPDAPALRYAEAGPTWVDGATLTVLQRCPVTW